MLTLCFRFRMFSMYLSPGASWALMCFDPEQKYCGINRNQMWNELNLAIYSSKIWNSSPKAWTTSGPASPWRLTEDTATSHWQHKNALRILEESLKEKERINEAGRMMSNLLCDYFHCVYIFKYIMIIYDNICIPYSTFVYSNIMSRSAIMLLNVHVTVLTQRTFLLSRSFSERISFRLSDGRFAVVTSRDTSGLFFQRTTMKPANTISKMLFSWA